MKNISVIDCTLRDGGYLNNWDFDDEFVCSTLRVLIQAKVDIIECGFASQVSGKNDKGTNYKSIEKINDFLKKNLLNVCDSKFALMVRFGEYLPENLPFCDKKENVVSVIRVMLHKDEVNNAVGYINKIIEKGYEVHIQPTIISHYTNDEIIQMLNGFRGVNYSSIALVDTFGALNNNDVEKIALVFDKYANESSALSIHCHNNLSLAQQNAVVFSEVVSNNRNVCIDSSINGLGRAGGNIATESLLRFLKENKFGCYLTSEIESFGKDCAQKFNKYLLGQDFYAYVYTAQKNIHPNYASFLISRKYDKTKIQKILNLISPEKKAGFDFHYIDNLCLEYNAIV